MPTAGTFFAVGIGAGDPLDMTLRARQTLEHADAIVAPVKAVGAASVAYDIAAQAADIRKIPVIHLVFPMRYAIDYRHHLQSGILQPVCDLLDAGKNVAMITLGDVSIYSTAAYARHVLAEQGYPTKVVAGVPSFCAAAAKAQCSLCENQESLLILSGTVTPESVEQALAKADNVVLMKARRALPWLLPLLEQRNLLETTQMFCNVGMEHEYIGSPHFDADSYFTTLLIQQRRK